MSGVAIIAKNSDFSASARYHAGLYTSVTANLECLHETRRSNSKAINNAVQGKASGSIVGAPTWSAGSGSMTQANAVQFGSRPASGGLTIAFVMKNVNLDGITAKVIGSLPGTSVTQGGMYVTSNNRRLTAFGYTYPYPASAPLPGGSYTSPSTYIDLLSADDGNYEMFFVDLEPNVSLRLYRPKTGTLLTAACVGRDFAFDSAPNFRVHTGQTLTSSGTLDFSVFAHWSAIKTLNDKNTFYAEIQKQMLALGVSI